MGNERYTSASMENIGFEILVTCTGLNDSKKADVNSVQENILAIITYRKYSKLGAVKIYLELDKH